jgi:hypothetical protein
MKKLERIVSFMPAFDKRNPDPSKNYGIGAVRCIMALKGSKGAITFTFSTGIYLDSTMQEYAKDGRLTPEISYGNRYFILNSPMGYDVGYHSGRKHFNGQGISQRKCEWRNGKPCYCDGSALRADEWMKILIENGSDEIWRMMEEDYNVEFSPPSTP